MDLTPENSRDGQLGEMKKDREREREQEREGERDLKWHLNRLSLDYFSRLIDGLI